MQTLKDDRNEIKIIDYEGLKSALNRSIASQPSIEICIRGLIYASLSAAFLSKKCWECSSLARSESEWLKRVEFLLITMYNYLHAHFSLQININLSIFVLLKESDL